MPLGVDDFTSPLLSCPMSMRAVTVFSQCAACILLASPPARPSPHLRHPQATDVLFNTPHPYHLRLAASLFYLQGTANVQ